MPTDRITDEENVITRIPVWMAWTTAAATIETPKYSKHIPFNGKYAHFQGGRWSHLGMFLELMHSYKIWFQCLLMLSLFLWARLCVCVWCGKKPLEIKLNLSENGFKRFSHTDFRLPFFEHLQILTRVPQKRNVQLLWASYISSYKHRFTNPFAIHIQRIIHFRCSGKARNQQCSPEMGKILFISLYIRVIYALYFHTFSPSLLLSLRYRNYVCGVCIMINQPVGKKEKLFFASKWFAFVCLFKWWACCQYERWYSIE